MITSTLQFSQAMLTRTTELGYLLARIADAQCVSVVGVSNVGKSAMLRDLCRADVRAALRPDLDPRLRFFYIDCNRLLDWSDQAFYELVLRVLIDELRRLSDPRAEQLVPLYAQILQPPSEFHLPLTFSQALTLLVADPDQPSVLVFDEFDAPYRELNPLIFLNLRGLKDLYPQVITYITATDRRLANLRQGEQLDEFKELFDPRLLYIPPLNPQDTRRQIERQVQSLHATFDDNDHAFLLAQAGGHTALTEIACRRLAEVTGAPQRSDSADMLIHREVRSLLHGDPNVRAECEKIWLDLEETEQAALLALSHPSAHRDGRAVKELQRKGMVLGEEDELRIFAKLFEHFVQQLHVVQKAGTEEGIRIDVESGEVTINGVTVETLTNLEYRLLLLFYGRLNKICDKYAIVEAVWGEEYIDEVYDSAIEKLISRLRHKIEPDPANPRYLVTVRGRGYKLVD